MEYYFYIWMFLGWVGEFYDYFSIYKCIEVVMVGCVKCFDFKKLNLDFKGFKLFLKVFKSVL